MSLDLLAILLILKLAGLDSLGVLSPAIQISQLVASLRILQSDIIPYDRVIGIRDTLPCHEVKDWPAESAQSEVGSVLVRVWLRSGVNAEGDGCSCTKDLRDGQLPAVQQFMNDRLNSLPV